MTKVKQLAESLAAAHVKVFEVGQKLKAAQKIANAIRDMELDPAIREMIAARHALDDALGMPKRVHPTEAARVAA